MTHAPLGDQALIAYLPDEAAAYRFAESVRRVNPPWLQDVVPAYTSVGVFFDADAVGLAEVSEWIRRLPQSENEDRSPKRSHVIPVCYEMQLDLDRVCGVTGLKPDDAIARHLGTEYTIYAIGFVPGFPYMGYLPEELRGVARLPTPRLRLDPGSVGLTGKQTAVYPLPRPGGWNIVGRTPLTLVDVSDGFFPLRVGDLVRFERIDERRFRELEGERLGV